MMQRVKYFDFEKVFSGTDEQFCRRHGVDPADLEQAKKQRQRKNENEKDVLWKYVNTPN